jgi:glycosyltransferase involved in cell wall biosynthesis
VKRLSRRHHLDVYSLSSANHEFADLRPLVAHHQVVEFRPLPLFGSPFGRLNPLIRLADLNRLRRIARGIAADIRREGYDVLLVHPCQYETAPSILSAVQDLVTVYYCHEPLRLLYEKTPVRPYDQAELTRRQVLNKIDPLPALYRSTLQANDLRNTRTAKKVLVNSRFTQSAVNRIYGVNSEVSYHGIDTGFFRPLGIPKRPILLSVGSLTPLKGFDFLIRAAAQLPRENRPCLVIASNFQNPPEKGYLEQLAAELQVDVQLVGNIDDQQLVEYYNQALVTVYAALREPFGLVPLESLACGTPVVAVREGGLQETLLDGETGYLTERDTQQFAAAIHSLVADPARAAEFGRMGRQHVLDNWTWDRAILDLENHLLQ